MRTMYIKTIKVLLYYLLIGPADAGGQRTIYIPIVKVQIAQYTIALL